MPLDPDAARQLEALRASGFPGFAALQPVEARAAVRALNAARTRDPQNVPVVAAVEDTTLGELPARVYRPHPAGAAVPTAVFLHGGGYVFGDLDVYDVAARMLCLDAGVVVVSVDYRLAPEHPFPAAVEDAAAALDTVAAQIERFGGAAGPLAVVGDSAGGNLAAGAARHARDTGLPLAAQALIYPTIDPGGDYPSRADNGEGYGLTTADLSFFMRHYAMAENADGDPDAVRRLADDPRIAPLRAERLDGLAPTVIATAEFDPLRDEGDAYAAALAAAGVPVVHRMFPGLVHGFYGGPYPAARTATRWVHEELRRLLDAAASAAAE